MSIVRNETCFLLVLTEDLHSITLNAFTSKGLRLLKNTGYVVRSEDVCGNYVKVLTTRVKWHTFINLSFTL